MAISNKKLQKIMTLPINQIFRYLQNRNRVQVWLHEQAESGSWGPVEVDQRRAVARNVVLGQRRLAPPLLGWPHHGVLGATTSYPELAAFGPPSSPT